MQTVTQWLQLNPVDDLTNEGELQQQLGLVLIDAPLLHIEHSRIVELSHCRAVRAFHVVGVDLQHRLGEHTGLLGHDEVLITFVRLRLL